MGSIRQKYVPIPSPEEVEKIMEDPSLLKEHHLCRCGCGQIMFKFQHKQHRETCSAPMHGWPIDPADVRMYRDHLRQVRGARLRAARK